MAVDVRCEICNRLIRRVEIKHVSSIQPDEICDECNKQVGDIYKDFEEGVLKFKIFLSETNAESLKKYKRINYRVENLYKEFKDEFDKSNRQLKKTHERYLNDIQGLFITTNAEIGDKIRKMGRFFKREG